MTEHPGEDAAVRKVLDAARYIDWYDVRLLRDIGGLDGLVKRLDRLVAAIDGLDFPTDRGLANLNPGTRGNSRATLVGPVKVTEFGGNAEADQ